MLKFNHVKYAYKHICTYHNKILFQYLSSYCSTFRTLRFFNLKNKACIMVILQSSCVANDRNVLSLRAWPKW